MTDPAPHTDPDDEPPAPTAKSAEDRKAATDLARLDAKHDEDDDATAAPTSRVDREAVSSAMKAGAGALAAAPARTVKVDQADVTLLVSPGLPLPITPSFVPPGSLLWGKGEWSLG